MTLEFNLLSISRQPPASRLIVAAVNGAVRIAVQMGAVTGEGYQISH
jgi:hypothetical protein